MGKSKELSEYLIRRIIPPWKKNRYSIPKERIKIMWHCSAKKSVSSHLHNNSPLSKCCIFMIILTARPIVLFISWFNLVSNVCFQISFAEVIPQSGFAHLSCLVSVYFFYMILFCHTVYSEDHYIAIEEYKHLTTSPEGTKASPRKFDRFHKDISFFLLLLYFPI